MKLKALIYVARSSPCIYQHVNLTQIITSENNEQDVTIIVIEKKHDEKYDDAQSVQQDKGACRQHILVKHMQRNHNKNVHRQNVLHMLTCMHFGIILTQNKNVFLDDIIFYY